MPIPANVLANADDFGYNQAVNRAILYSYEKQYLNSSSLLTNTHGFDEAVEMIHQHKSIINVGVHVNFAEGTPLTNVPQAFLKDDGTWNIAATGRTLQWLSGTHKQRIYSELVAQIDKAIAHKVPLNHIDTHYHIHTLPAFYPLFLKAAKQYRLKLRLAQTYREGSYLKYFYRVIINNKLIREGLNYTDKFETVDHFMSNRGGQTGGVTEVMLHPAYDNEGRLTDHYDAGTMQKWINICQTTA